MIDLGRRRAEAFDLHQQWGREYLGGPGLAARFLYRKGNQDDMVIAPGLFAGLPVHTACKASICAVSPLTGRWGESSVGGRWPIQIKRAGWDMIWVRGKSSGWTTIKIHDDRVDFESAESLAGCTTSECRSALVEKLGRSYEIACIGPAAEKGVKFASIHAGRRVAGRCGMGLDWARRKIKAVAVRGSHKIEAADQEGLKKSVRAYLEAIQERCHSLHSYGTAGGTTYREAVGVLPIKNFIQGRFEKGAKKITGQAMVKAFDTKRKPCPQCPIACGKEIKVKSLKYEGPMPEYETVASLGAMLLVDDPKAVIEGNRICNEYGMDTISAGVTAAFAVEAFERGYLCQDDFGGLKPRWGSGKFLVGLLENMAKREGIGDLLADGVKAAAEEIGKGAEPFAMHCHGLELPMHDPRAFWSMGATYVVGPRGAVHSETMSYYLDQRFDLTDMGYPEGLEPQSTEGKGRGIVVMQNLASVYDNLGICKFMLVADIGPTALCGWLRHATGWEMDGEELLKTGALSVTIKNFFNIDRLGIKPDMEIPRRILTEPRGEGAAADSLPDIETIVRDYYRERGWSDEGYPPDSERPGES